MLTRMKNPKKYGMVKLKRLMGETTTNTINTTDTHMLIR